MAEAKDAETTSYLEISNAPPPYEDVDELPGRFGKFGGRYIPETLAQAHEELEKAYIKATQDPEFRVS